LRLTPLVSAWAEETVVATEGSPRSIGHWKQVWKSWESSSSTIEIEEFGFAALRTGSDEFASKSQSDELIERIRRLVASTDAPTLFDLESPSQISFPVGTEGKSKGLWGTCHLIQCLDKVRLDHTPRLPPGEGETYDPVNYKTLLRTVTRVDGKEVEYIDRNRRVSVYDSYRQKEIGTNSTYVLAPTHLDRYTQRNTSVLAENRVRYFGESPDAGTIELHVDAQSGFIHRLRYAAGPFFEEIHQYLPISQEHEIPVARLITTVKGRNDVPDLILMHVLTSVRLGGEIPVDRFLLSVPEGVLVVKFPEFGAYIPPSQGGTRPPMERVLSTKPDALALIQESGFGKGADQIPIQSPSKPSRWLFITNITALLLLLAYFGVRRYRQSKSNLLN